MKQITINKISRLLFPSEELSTDDEASSNNNHEFASSDNNKIDINDDESSENGLSAEDLYLMQ